MTIEVRSPTRVDLAGGTLDCWPLYSFVNGCITTNLSIDIYTHVRLTKREDQRVCINLLDRGFAREFENLKEAMACNEPCFDLLKIHFEYWKPEWGFEIECRSESPVGGGLGGSSSLTVSLIKAFSKAENQDLSEFEIVNLASNLEARLLGTPTGTQDYYPANQSGLHLIHYRLGGVEHENLKVDTETLAKKMFLVYTGQPHHSGLNNWSVIQSAVNRDKNTLKELQALKEVAAQVAMACRRQSWSDLGLLFSQEYNHRVALAPAFNSESIDKVRTLCLGAGAEAIKICGAGGGGCVLVWCKDSHKPTVMRSCEEHQFQVFDISPAIDSL